MRKLILQMQVSADGFVSGPDGQLDWMTWNWDEQLVAYVQELTLSFDTILLGRKMTPGFTGHWENVVEQPDSPEYAAARVFVDTPKIVFSKTLSEMPGKNLRVENGDVVAVVNALKQQPGKNIMVYGGAGFVGSLVENGLIDELNLFVNPTAIGSGIQIFHQKTPLELIRAQAFPCGIVALRYKPGTN